MRPVHEALRKTLSAENLQTVADVAEELAGTNPEAAGKTGEKEQKVEVRPMQFDERLKPLLEKGESFLALTPEYLPAEIAGALKEAVKPGAAAESVKAAEVMEEAEPVEAAAEASPAPPRGLEQGICAAVSLVGCERNFSADWPSAVRYLIPCTEASVPGAQIWAPVLAYVLLRAIPNQTDLAAAFEKLQLRPALAEIFSSFGLEGENAWRAAARVRVLLLADQSKADSLLDQVFWKDADVRWLAGVNESHGVTYVNKEGFEELVTVLQIPALLAVEQAAVQPSVRSSALAGVEAKVAHRIRAIATAGYKLGEFLAAKPAVTKPDTTPAEADSKAKIALNSRTNSSSTEDDVS